MNVSIYIQMLRTVWLKLFAWSGYKLDLAKTIFKHNQATYRWLTIGMRWYWCFPECCLFQSPVRGAAQLSNSALCVAHLSLVRLELCTSCVGFAQFFLQADRVLHVGHVIFFQELHLSFQITQILQFTLVGFHRSLQYHHPIRAIPSEWQPNIKTTTPREPYTCSINIDAILLQIFFYDRANPQITNLKTSSSSLRARDSSARLVSSSLRCWTSISCFSKSSQWIR